ncbi:hypothetical protein [Chryseobacterium sp. 3008163]|uniref:hypothetical protein n=1 Tax=Chryseobacterium sp. 3008163 TaxID=2478663 RepID=UPI000F0C18AC|nr:hypothetical protein [Chryseobacterium sp. 3008163]AYN00849.1 hypothetical protein EAG08_11480 [Chryseobacterium sp. 3008163]
MLNHKDRLQWHKNSLIERSGYVLFYMNSLRDHLPVEDRQTLYMIAKYFTDAVEFARTNIPAAEYFFEIGERYQCEIPEDKVLLKKLIFNSYDRAKSYYFLKLINMIKLLKGYIILLKLIKTSTKSFRF